MAPHCLNTSTIVLRRSCSTELHHWQAQLPVHIDLGGAFHKASSAPSLPLIAGWLSLSNGKQPGLAVQSTRNTRHETALICLTVLMPSLSTTLITKLGGATTSRLLTCTPDKPSQAPLCWRARKVTLICIADSAIERQRSCVVSSSNCRIWEHFPVAALRQDRMHTRAASCLKQTSLSEQTSEVRSCKQLTTASSPLQCPSP